jgi:hypothetical protein
MGFITNGDDFVLARDKIKAYYHRMHRAICHHQNTG